MDGNEKNKSDGKAWVILILTVLVLLALLSLCGCKSTREVQDYRELYRMENEQVTMMRDSVKQLHQRIDMLKQSLEKSDSLRMVSRDSTDTREKVEVYVRDSVSTMQRGDTIYIDRWHWDNRNYQLLQTKVRLDSVQHNLAITELQNYVSILQDSIAQLHRDQLTSKESKEQTTKETIVIEKQTAWWVKALAWIGGMCIATFAAVAIMMVRVRKEEGSDDR